MKRIGWIRTHGLLHRKTIFIIPFGEILRIPMIKTFLLYIMYIKKGYFELGRTNEVRTHEHSLKERLMQTTRP